MFSPSMPSVTQLTCWIPNRWFVPQLFFGCNQDFRTGGTGNPQPEIESQLPHNRIHGTGIFTYIWLIFMVYVGEYTIRIHGSYGFYFMVRNGWVDYDTMKIPWQLNLFTSWKLQIHNPTASTFYHFVFHSRKWAHIPRKHEKTQSSSTQKCLGCLVGIVVI